MADVKRNDVKTKWGTVIHLRVSQPEGESFSWERLQEIKDEEVGKERVAVEVYPKDSDVVNEKNYRHLWVLPKSFKLPFGLRKEGGAVVTYGEGDNSFDVDAANRLRASAGLPPIAPT